jgi:hypothetical protein
VKEKLGHSQSLKKSELICVSESHFLISKMGKDWVWTLLYKGRLWSLWMDLNLVENTKIAPYHLPIFLRTSKPTGTRCRKNGSHVCVERLFPSGGVGHSGGPVQHVSVYFLKIFIHIPHIARVWTVRRNY